jgi:hypothetical protein
MHGDKSLRVLRPIRLLACVVLCCVYIEPDALQAGPASRARVVQCMLRVVQCSAEHAHRVMEHPSTKGHAVMGREPGLRHTGTAACDHHSTIIHTMCP